MQAGQSFVCAMQLTAVDLANTVSWGLVVPNGSFSGNYIGDAPNSIGCAHAMDTGKTKFNGTGLAVVELDAPRLAVGVMFGFRLQFSANSFNAEWFVNDRVIHAVKNVPWKVGFCVAATLATNARIKLLGA
jgi:hypothetical protein